MNRTPIPFEDTSGFKPDRRPFRGTLQELLSQMAATEALESSQPGFQAGALPSKLCGEIGADGRSRISNLSVINRLL